MVDHELPIQFDGRARPQLANVESIPLTKRLIRENEWVFASRSGRIVPQPAGSLVGPDVPLATFLGEVPNLNLGCGAEIDPAVGTGHRAVIHPQFYILKVTIGRQENAVTIVDQFAAIDRPMLLGVFRIGGLALCPLLVRHRRPLRGRDIAPTMPSR